MASHQYLIREKKSKEEKLNFNILDVNLKNTELRIIDKETAKKIIIEYEWLKSMPYITLHCFGLYFKINNNEYLGGVLVFSNDYADNTGVWDKYGFTNKLILLSRGVCLWWTPKNTASYMISRACKWLKKNTKYRIVTATVDPLANEIGTIYQSLNWYYVGLMSGNYHNKKESKRFSVIIDGKLRYSRWVRKQIGTIKKEEILKRYPDAKFVPQYRKRRYFYFMDTKNKNKFYYDKIKHMLLPYPKRDMSVMGIIYKITNKINGKIYIGQTIRNLNDRINDYRRGYYHNDYLKNSFLKYGFDNFTFECIDIANSLDELNDKEIYYIKKLKSRNKDIGYNIAEGGKNSIPDNETRKRMSLAHSGVKQNDEWINKRIAIKGSEDAKKYGRSKTEEEKKYLSEKSPKFWSGKKRDEETRKKISETKLKNGLSNKAKESYCKKVYKINIKTREIKEYYSTGNASKCEGNTQSTISRWCNKDTIKNGFLWTYKNDEDFINKTINNIKSKENNIHVKKDKINKTKSPPIKQSSEWVMKRVVQVSKPVIKVDRVTNEITDSFDSLADAGSNNSDGLSYGQIERLCNNRVKDSKYFYVYKEDYDSGKFGEYIGDGIEYRKLEDVSDREFDEIYNLNKRGVSLRELSRTYRVYFSNIVKYVKNRELEEKGDDVFEITKDMVAICKKTGKVFNDAINKSGIITNHIRECWSEVEIPSSKYLRKKVKLETGKDWYYPYFEFKK